MARILTCLAVAICAVWSSRSAHAVQALDGVVAGDLIVERPTLICLGFEWRITGDENRNASVTVQYRRQGDFEWRLYLPLYRIGKGREVLPGYGNFDDPDHKPLYRIPDGFDRQG